MLDCDLLHLEASANAHLSGPTTKQAFDAKRDALTQSPPFSGRLILVRPGTAPSTQHPQGHRNSCLRLLCLHWGTVPDKTGGAIEQCLAIRQPTTQAGLHHEIASLTDSRRGYRGSG